MHQQDSILDLIRTSYDAELFEQELETLSESLYKGDQVLERALREKVRFKISKKVRDDFKKVEDKAKYLSDLKKALSKVARVNLVCAFEPSESSIERFYQFLKDEIKKDLILDIGYDPQIIGGAIVIYQGMYRDFSFKKIFEDEFEKGRSQFIKMINQSKKSSKNN